MKKLIKLVPAMALLLALGVYTVNAKMKAAVAEKTQTEQKWMLKSPNLNPADPDNYEPTTGSISDCRGIEEVCMVEAPASAEDSEKPNFSDIDGLEEALSSDLDHENIHLAPYTPTF
ncbi:hypothetical protein ORI89_06840 [Sphingobacterium sp. UT-1RO-CII-1]|uniref:hypothetical protein n=1 Tax=Sphingobacterium sp. UT-1RO-CII-1 TaxID=2995225 RepID=UPI00227C8557|nr:hypothetical protein [Sphingobacterium sp. UT-1RO-CII-1]MCY4779359.1 hypothetical protein [Sphingobacterium sp. UT-1RO-CII-1]